MTSLVHNERIKLLAGALNTTGIGVTVTGAVAPTIGALYGNLATVPRWWLLLIAFACLGTGVILHLGAQYILGRLRDG